ncbi:MAG: RtcB family protein [Phycisphaerales bacterium]|nr:RtcB family protein [Phycisphaerales bacterium]MCB9856590.1 RtcB family protein [Phycisphaerales bacterium]MCB9864613.1 RtcB family protein [Phycisphaerales bacterium]
MKARELNKIGFPKGPIVADILKACGDARSAGMNAAAVRDAVNTLHANPESMLESPHFGAIAAELINGAPNCYDIRDESEAGALYQVWGADQIDAGAIKQMENAVRLPISVGGALMPDAHLGYGLPIGGVLATEGAVIPYAVGVDIACRMMLSVLPMPIEGGGPDPIDKNENELIRAVEKHTRFGAGAKFKGRERREAPVMDLDWNISPIIRRVRPKAEEQLGTSGGGNHFVDIGEIEFPAEFRGVPAGRYVAILTHSGSRGPGAMTCEYYSKLAMSQHPNIPREFRHLSWLPLDGDGAEYWEAMQLMGEFASANHHCIHSTILRELKLTPLLQIENHHNYAWKEMHGGREVIVHRKGATPAAKGDIGIIPGSMASPAYVVEGKGNHASYDSAAHGAGRVMSRTQAKQTFCWNPVRKDLVKHRVKLISAGLDEVPGVYKNIDQVMAAQSDLVDTRARFLPRIVKMADDGFVED